MQPELRNATGGHIDWTPFHASVGDCLEAERSKSAVGELHQIDCLYIRTKHKPACSINAIGGCRRTSCRNTRGGVIVNANLVDREIDLADVGEVAWGVGHGHFDLT